MTILNYHSARTLPKPLTLRILYFALTAFSILLTYPITCFFLADYPFPLPHWLKDIFPFFFLPALIATILGTISLATAPSSAKNTRQLIFLSFLSLIPISSPVLLLFSWPPPERFYCSQPSSIIAANARGIAQSCLVYASDNAGHYPRHLSILLLTQQITPHMLSNYDTPFIHLPSPLPPESAWPSLAPSVDACSAFIYTGGDLTDSSLDPAIIVAYSKKCRVLPNCRVFAFADSHAELIPDSDLPKTFTASNTARAKLHLPPFTEGGPPPLPKAYP